MNAMSAPVTAPAVPARVQDVPAATTRPTSRPLTSADRCDVCNAQAYVRVVYVRVVLGRGELYFCGHHARAAGARLREAALLYQDETSRLAAG